MRIRLAVFALPLTFLCASLSADESNVTARAEFETLVEQFEDEGGTSEFAPKFFDLASRYRSDPVAVDAYVWILRNRRTKEDANRAIDLIDEHHLRDANLAEACKRIAKVPSPKAEQLLSTLVKSNPHKKVRATACHQLTQLLEQQASTLEQLARNPELKQRAAQYYGKHLVDLPLDRVNARLECVYEQMSREFGAVTLDDEKLGEVAEHALFRLRHLSIGRVAPEIIGEDIFGDTFKLSDYRGKVVVLSFWAHW